MRNEESQEQSCITHYALRITHYALRITHYALRITHYALRITHYALRITHYALRITHFALRPRIRLPPRPHHVTISPHETTSHLGNRFDGADRLTCVVDADARRRWESADLSGWQRSVLRFTG